MSKICKVTINDEPFLANRGELLLDWALMNGVDLPHDCRSGICGACRVRLVDGQVFGGHSRGDDMIHACQAESSPISRFRSRPRLSRWRCRRKWRKPFSSRPM